jgi:hypothetical protein
MLDPVPDLPAGEPGVRDTDETYLASTARGTTVTSSSPETRILSSESGRSHLASLLASFAELW